MRSRCPAPTRGTTMTPSSAWRTLALTSVAVFVVSLDGTVLFVAFPAIRATFAHVSAAQLCWVFNAYTVSLGDVLEEATSGPCIAGISCRRRLRAGRCLLGSESAN